MRNDFYPLYNLPQISDLKDMIEQKVEAHPDKIAFTYLKGRTQIVKKTFMDFCNDVNALGTWIFESNLNGKHIAIVGENSYDWLVLFFAIVNGGSVAVPIDKELPVTEISEFIKKADVDAVFYSEAYKKSIDVESVDLLFSFKDIGKYIAEGRELISKGNMNFVDYKIEPKKLCCILFTSGTSGSSKGVMLSHKNFASDINSNGKLFSLEGNSFAVLPFHHAFGLLVSVFMVFYYGYTTFINKSLKNVKDNLKIAKPQTLVLVPLFVETFYKQIWTTAEKEGRSKFLRVMMCFSDILLKVGIDLRKKLFSSVRDAFGGNAEYIICGGADLGAKYIKEFRSWGIEILNGYGATECSPCIAVNRNKHHKDGTVGLALPGTKVKIADDGEVLVAGENVMLGYYNDEVSTKEVLVEGWYSTGDLGYIDGDGFLSLTGRKKNLIIRSNGENVSPEELERNLMVDEAVREVVVYAKDDIIVAEIYPEEKYIRNLEYFNQLIKNINKGRPVYKHINKIELRDSEFIKNTSKKIIRQKM